MCPTDTLYRTVVISLVWLALFIPVIRGGDEDTSWELSNIAVWVTAEANLVIICGCFPALKLLARRLIPKWLGSEASRSSNVDCDQIMPPPWQSELCTVTTGISGGSRETKDSTAKGYNSRNGSGFDSGTGSRYDGSSNDRAVKLLPGQVLPEP